MAQTAAAKGKTRAATAAAPAAGGGPRRRRHSGSPTRKLASGPSTWQRASRQGRSRRKSQNAQGLQPSVRRDGGGQHFHRWYRPQTGTYSRPDPLALNTPADHVYFYAKANPLLYSDPLGSLAEICCRLLNNMVFESIARQRHCYVKGDDGTVYRLFPQVIKGRRVGVPEINNPDDTGGICRDCPCEGEDQDACLRREYYQYPVGNYDWLGPNSNTFAGTLAKECCGGIPDELGSAPGIDDPPPAPVFIIIRDRP